MVWRGGLAQKHFFPWHRMERRQPPALGAWLPGPNVAPSSTVTSSVEGTSTQAWFLLRQRSFSHWGQVPGLRQAVPPSHSGGHLCSLDEGVPGSWPLAHPHFFCRNGWHLHLSTALGGGGEHPALHGDEAPVWHCPCSHGREGEPPLLPDMPCSAAPSLQPPPQHGTHCRVSFSCSAPSCHPHCLPGSVGEGPGRWRCVRGSVPVPGLARHGPDHLRRPPAVHRRLLQGLPR